MNKIKNSSKCQVCNGKEVVPSDETIGVAGRIILISESRKKIIREGRHCSDSPDGASFSRLNSEYPMSMTDLAFIVTQRPLIDMTQEVPKERRRLKVERIKADDMFSQVRQLHEQINVYLHKCPTTECPIINNSADAADLLMPFIAHLEHEEFWIILLNRRNSVTQLVRLYQGSVNSSQVRIGEVFRQAIVEQSSAIVIAHNHPSNDPTPSPDDVAVTSAIVQAGKLLDIDVLDHLIICRGSFVSLKEQGLGFA